MFPKNFSEKEFSCQGRACCSNSAPMDGAFLKKLQQLRDALERPIIITSGFRCNQRNRHVGGAKSSYHTFGRACDIKVKGVDVEALAELAKEVFNGVIIYKTWVHVDNREGLYYADKR